MITWEELEYQCRQCTQCPLYESRTQVVFGAGSHDAEIMFVGEGPGRNEDLQGEPFVGAAGHLLDEMLYIIDLDRSNSYIANIVKCRPPGNRDPLLVEQDACIPWLRYQTRLLKPKIIVCLGRISATRLIKSDFKISREHGLWFEKAGIHFMALYHPAALLRDPSKKPDTFRDLKQLQKMVRQICTHTYPD